MDKITRNNFYKSRWVILAVICLGVILRLINFNEGLWLDEIWSMVTSGPDRSAMDIIDACKVDTHPPFYDLLLHYIILLIPGVDVAGRMLALVLGVIGIVATYYYAIRISGNEKVAFIALMLVSFSFFHITYSSESRFYTLLYLLSLMVISQLFLYLKESKKLNIVLFAISGIVLTYTHYYGAILLFSLGIVVLVLALQKQISSGVFWKFCFAAVIIVLSFIPWLPYLLANNATESWMSKPNIGYFFEYIYNYTGKNPIEFLFILMALVLSFPLLHKNIKLRGLLYGSIILGFCIPLLVSLMTVPMLHYRYTFIYFPSIILLTAIFWEYTALIKPKVKGIVYSIVILSMFINFFFINNITDGLRDENWREAAMLIRDQNSENNTMIYCEQFFHLNYYLKRNNQRLSTLPEEKLANQFWFFKTSYDKESYSFADSHHIIESVDYGNNFVLHLYELTE